MDCDICSRPFGERRRPLCPSCAQVSLYDGRFKQAAALLDQEKHRAQAEAVVRPGNDGVLAALPEDADLDAITTGMRRHGLERSQAQTTAAELRIDSIVDKAADLKRELEQFQQHIAAQKEDAANRRKALAVQKDEFERVRPRATEPVLSTTKKASQRLEKVRSRIVDARLLLCREAALAMNFHRRKGADGRSEYVLGSIVVPDLRELNIRTQPAAKAPLVGGRTIAEPHDLVSESFENVARLLNLCATYLGVRLPGEILLPHEKFPRAAVMPEKSSYKHSDIAFPGLSSSQSSSPAASRIIEHNLPRPRPLWLEKPLAQLLKDDPKAYGLYIEGITMLAYNVAWLCKSQGVDGINGFDDICAVGKNLYQLLLTQHRKHQPRPALDRQTTGTSSRVTATSAKDAQQQSATHLGVFSHTSASHNLFAAEASELMKNWRLASSTRLADKLRSHLYNEVSRAEWDVVEMEEWDEESTGDAPVLVGGSRRPFESRHPAMSIMTVAAHDGAEEDRSSSAADEGQRKKQVSGWMKVRGRGGEGA
ncbi:hypothetical protein CKM354_000664400 [Cercospora kikuchii]|uniref:Autophagy-related protein 14 n=1 Tax=Cercospora kikuchii TaxID=84275 RepID=A0A9P3CJS1_9PEZI|nr:uncharacterized protein CKM354_000664400 [Cercospora kikuchii]GIZ43416.1 hypothetical protein CKM354_000664400 [Cercospora kikuchii]